YSTNDGTATTADNDYIDNDNTLTFNPGEPLSQDITILVNGDTNVEEDETFTLSLNTVTNGIFTGNVATLEATGTIENDDFNAGTLTFSNATYEVVEDNNTVQITIMRNDGNHGEVTVDYTTSDGTATAGEDYTAVSGTLTFNDGQSIKTITIPINNDSVNEEDESFTVTLSNPTNGAILDTENTATITITDTDIPDLIVSNLSASTPIYTDKTATVNYRVENQGTATVSGSWVDAVYLSQDNQLDENDTLLAENTFTPSTPFDSFYERDLTFFTPEIPGQYYLIAVTDSTNTVDEGSEIGETNNTNLIPITVEPAYGATVSTNTEISIPGDSITFEGIAVSNVDNSPAPYELVTIAVKHNGFVREFHILTEEDGSFTQEFTPLAGEAGNYEINAYFPDYLTEDSAPEDSFKLLGMDFNKTGVFHQILADNPFTEQVELANLTDVSLTGLTYTIDDAPDDWNLQVIAPETLAGDGTNNISYTIEAPNDSLFTQDTFSINVNSDQGVTASLPVTVNVKQLVPQLIADVNPLNTGMLRGEQTFVEFEISNNGGAETGNIQVMLPQVDWLSLSSPSIINSLLPGESTNVTLSLTPDNDLPLTLYNGNLVFDVIGNSGDLSLPYTFRAVSEAVGSVEVTVIDERFYFAENTPKLDNATVKIRDYFTGEIVAQGVTNESGTINLDNLSEGYYQLNVEAENHDSYQQTIQIQAGEITEVQSFLSRQSVSYLWRVLPTEIEDRYVITIESVFETNVPEPVVTISPALIDLETLQTVGQVIQTEMTLTNHGLIAANDVTLNFGDHPFYDIEPLVDDIGILAAQSSLTIPVRVTRIDDFSDENENDYISCGIPASLQWSYDCGPNTVVKTTPIPILNVEGNCPVPPIIPLPYTPYRPSTPPTGDTGPIQAISSPTPIIITPRPDCNICAQVRPQTTQDAVMTRSAFLGILDIDNGNEIPLENLSVTLDIRDAFGNPVNGLFAIADPTLSNLNAVDGTGILTPDTTGTSQWTIVPTASAAPEAPTVYSIGGSLNYTEDGTVITVPLLGTPVTVLPQAELYVDYFHQREVFSDDPFTDEIEPSVPFVLGVMVRNEGYGAANNLQITSAQPKIIENEKGLLIDFDIIATELGINPVNPSLSIDFGDIEAGEITVANWLFKSSLQGKFIEYDATFEHINDLGIAELSLIKQVNIHELTHKVRVDHPTDDQLPDFLVNDIADDNFYPDTLYFSDGNTAPVNVLTDATTTVHGQTVTITTTVDQGWTYLRLDDPTNGELKITQVLRDDGTPLRSDNFWTSDRTFPESGRPVYEDILHLLDYHNSSGEITYTLSTTQQEVNEPPNAQNDEIETDQNVPVTIDILANDSDVDGDVLSISDVTQAVNGTVTVNADNTLTYTPNVNFNGTDSFSYTVEDGQGG
ncbi:MAG: Calx-beta domain-containing protein, partial [Crocosphaera sp.]